jgi:hypothetical protein
VTHIPYLPSFMKINSRQITGLIVTTKIIMFLEENRKALPSPWSRLRYLKRTQKQ